MTEGTGDELRKPMQAGRRTWDHVYYFAPIVLSFVIGAFWYAMTASYIYGSLTKQIEGEFKLVNYRLEQLERQGKH